MNEARGERRRRGRRGGRARGCSRAFLSRQKATCRIPDESRKACFGNVLSEQGEGDRGDQAMNKERAAHDGLSEDKVPRSVCALLQRVIGTVKSSATRLAVYLRGWDTLRKFSEGSVVDPPACSTCILAANKRGVK